MGKLREAVEDGTVAEVGELRAANTRLMRQLASAKARTEGLVEVVYQAARDAALAMGPAPAVPKPPADRRRSRREEVALVHATDWQYGKHTSSYSIEVCEQRINLLAERVAALAEIQRADHPVRACHVMLGGDMVEGVGIFPGQAWEVEASLYGQLFGCSALIEQLIRRLLASFDTVEVWEEYGNHGRIGRKGENPGRDNIDLMAYRIAQQRLSGETRLTWHPTSSWHQIVEVGNYRALLVHGDEVRSFGGNTPAFGIARKVNAWSTGVVERFDDCYMGHWHQPLTVPLAHGRGRVFVSPSPESGNEYAREFVAATGTPGQRLNFVDPDRGRVTAEYIVWLD